MDYLKVQVLHFLFSPHQTPLCMSLLCHMCYMTRPLIIPDWIPEYLVRCTSHEALQYGTFSSHFLPFGPKYLPQLPNLIPYILLRDQAHLHNLVVCVNKCKHSDCIRHRGVL